MVPCSLQRCRPSPTPRPPPPSQKPTSRSSSVPLLHLFPSRSPLTCGATNGVWYSGHATPPLDSTSTKPPLPSTRYVAVGRCPCPQATANKAVARCSGALHLCSCGRRVNGATPATSLAQAVAFVDISSTPLPLREARADGGGDDGDGSGWQRE